MWVVYADVLTECGPYELGGDQLGRGGNSLTILPQWDVLGVAGGREFSYCIGDELSGPHSPESELPGRWTGGLAHELGHAFGLSHPPGCDQERFEICDDKSAPSLMGFGYDRYPGTYLRSADEEILMRSHFFNPDLGFLSHPPASLRLDQFYQKYLDADGLPIVASSIVPDRVLFTARDMIDEMLALREDIRVAIAAQEVRVAVMAHGSVLTDLPEFSGLTEFSPEVSWDERTRGGGVGPTDTRPVVAIAEENLLCYGGDDVFPYEDIFVHEFAHAVLNMGIERLPGGGEFRRRLEVAYADALEAGLWESTYAGENPDEYWAEGVQSWFGLNDPPGPIHNEVNTRVELEAYDPVLASLIREVFGDVTISASCHETIDLKQQFRIRGVVTGPDGEPLEGIGLWAWQGEATNSGYGQTGADGVFDIRVPSGSFTLDVYAVSGECSFVGWYDGTGGLTTTSSLAARVVVDVASVGGINIRLPAPPGDLPFIEHCTE